MIWGLRLPASEKLALSGVFLLGGFVVFASIFRLVSFTKVTSNDTTYSIYSTTIWTFIEPCLGLVCACLPAIRSLFPSTRKDSSKPTPQNLIQPPIYRYKTKEGVGALTQELRDLSEGNFESREVAKDGLSELSFSTDESRRERATADTA